eukprot:XP_001705361.1 Hypothetical protein GL50803_101264 [Giardia lamblia ATCC 50803]
MAMCLPLPLDKENVYMLIFCCCSPLFSSRSNNSITRLSKVFMALLAVRFIRLVQFFGIIILLLTLWVLILALREASVLVTVLYSK